MGGSADLARHQNRAAGASKVGGRVDVTKDINEIRLTGSVTDATARDYEVGELSFLEELAACTAGSGHAPVSVSLPTPVYDF